MRENFQNQTFENPNSNEESNSDEQDAPMTTPI